MKQILVSFGAGVMFALGLGLGGMTQPAKVIGFLDFTGNWDPSLAFVMIGAIAVYAAAYRMSRKRSTPVWAAAFSLPTRKDIDGRLVAGAAIFGLGWGIAGFCPAPGLTASASGQLAPVVFSVAMLGGMAVYKAGEKLPVSHSGGRSDDSTLARNRRERMPVDASRANTRDRKTQKVS